MRHNLRFILNEKFRPKLSGALLQQVSIVKNIIR
jgi:hypothetical protein